jgi:ketosteroid isomerase-like protein
LQPFEARKGRWAALYLEREEALDAMGLLEPDRSRRLLNCEKLAAMPQENVEVVRQPIALKARPRRRLEERIYLRFPSAVAFVTRAAWRLPPRSRPRRAFLLRAAHSGFDALNRGDFEASFMLYHPDGQFITPPSLVGLGFDPSYRGRERRSEFQRGWVAAWGEMRFEPKEMLDLGDRLLFVGRVRGSGVSSGAAFESDWACLFTISAAQVVREQPFFDRREALAAAGLSEQDAYAGS